jgi:predicted TIM-barrel fold metal-dependent hydrolase
MLTLMNFSETLANNINDNNNNSLYNELGEDGKQWLLNCFQNIDITKIVDVHTHICGKGTNDSGCYIYSKMNSFFKHPLLNIKKRGLFSACQIKESDENADQNYVKNLVELVRTNKPIDSDNYGKCMILAFDAVYSETGELLRDATGMYTPNDWVFKAAQDYPDCFIPVCSVNPYRVDAIKELERCYKLGARVVKWLPNSMGIDPDNGLCVRFYQKMKELNMTLLSHAGDENSVSSDVLDNKLGNPLKLTLALDNGVKVIVAHCATEGCNCTSHSNQDQESESVNEVKRENFDIFMDMMNNDKYKDLLFGDISAILSFRRVKYIETLLDTPEIHDRLYFGTDYPVPCIGLITLTSVLQFYKLITNQERVWLNIVYKYNVLLFDFCAKRTVKSSKGNKFADKIFQGLNN